MSVPYGSVGSDLEQQREQALGQVLTFAFTATYLWCLALFPTGDLFGPVWLAPLILAGGLAIAFLVRRRHTSLAAVAVILGLAAADVYAIWLLGMGFWPYMLAVVVCLTGIFFGRPVVLLACIADSGLVFAAGSLRWGYSPLAPESMGPVVVIWAVGLFSMIWVRNLHWAWDRALSAQHHERELRERRAELARTAKALDEACQRLEYMNFDLAQAREAAEEARLIKQQFTTNVSHELRTPLNVIVAFSEMMYLSPESYGGVTLPREYLGDVREIYRAGQHLLRLTEDILDLSQITVRRLRIYQEPANLAEVVAEAAAIIRPLLRSKDITLRTELPADLPQVTIDRARVRQVLLNLLNNARRFTDQGSITIRAAVEGEWVKMTVADTGIGIAPADHDKVFEEFRQIDGSARRRRDGTGLGLSISRHFVELHGGRIWVESEGVPGRGSQFHFTLPLVGTAPVTPSDLQRTPLNLAQPSSRGRSLLLLDEDAATARLLETSLPSYRVIPVGDISQIPALLDQSSPRAVLINSASRQHAWRELWAVRKQLADAAVPVVLCPLVSEHQLGQALGVSAYLLKPVSRAALVGALDRLGDGVQRILVVDDDRRMAQVLSRMIRSSGRSCKVVRAYDGESALREMRRERPDLILLDLVMPGMDGYSLLAEMRRDAGLASIPVVVITAQEHTPEAERRLGRPFLAVARGPRFSNEEALAYLKSILEANGPSSGSAMAGDTADV